ncbi:MAG TPA: cation diffusion facilitator family transporter [Gemmatimonadales bacterium]|jgi:cobalt-zinc-cadmium efflux system protein
MTPKPVDMAQKVSSPSPIPRKIAIVLALTAAFTVVEIAGSLMSNSLTLLADASHMGTDVAALALALVGARIAQRREGPAQHFGNLRWEVLAAMMNGLALFVIGILITVEAIDRFGHPRAINAVLFGGVAAAGLLVNLLSLRVLHGHHEENLNARGAYLHILGDVLGSVGAIVGAIVIHYTGWTRVDPIISVLVSVIILRSAWRLVRTSGLILLDRVPDHLQPARVEAAMMAVQGVTRVHDLHVWTVASGLIAMSAHAVAPDLDAHPAILRRLEQAMGGMGIRHVTIQLETGDECVGELCGDDDGSADTLMLDHGHGHSHTHGHPHGHVH